MEFGLFTEFHSPPGVSEAAAFDESLAQMKAAADFGFDAVWLGEIHFQKDRSVLAARLIIASALAACTRRVKIGIAVQVLPLSHPLRLAEDVATVDHISKGRLEFGVGRSGLPGHYQGFNIPYSESRDRFIETLDILRKAWTQERFSHQGEVFPVSGRLHHAQAVSEAAPAHPHRGHHPGDLPDGRTDGGAGLRRRAHGVAHRSEAAPAELPGGLDRVRPPGSRRRRREHAALRRRGGAPGP